MRVIGIDPGYDRLGVAILEGDGNKQTLIFSTCIKTSAKLPFAARLGEVGTELRTIIETYEPKHLGIETLFFSKNVKTAMMVAEARGVILFIMQTSGVIIHEYSPQAIKIAVTGHGASSKEQMGMMLPRLVKEIPQDALDDEYDAIAAGIACLASERFTGK